MAKLAAKVLINFTRTHTRSNLTCASNYMSRCKVSKGGRGARGNVSVAAIIIDSIIIIGSVQTNKAAAAAAAKYATRLPKTVKVLQKDVGKGLVK